MSLPVRRGTSLFHGVRQDSPANVRHGLQGAPLVPALLADRFLLGRLFSRLPDPRFEPFTPGPELRDGDLLPVAGGLRVVHTPGHSPGHVALLHEPSRTLITGDSIFNVTLRGLMVSPRFLCADFVMTQQTAHRLGELEYDVAAFTHGKELTDGARERIRGFLRRLPTSA